MVVDSRTKEAFLQRALAAQAAYLPEIRAEIGPESAEWISAQTFFSDQTAIEEFILFEQSRYAGVDLKTAGALLMNDYSYILAAATVPLFTVWPHSRPLAHIGWTLFLYDRKIA